MTQGCGTVWNGEDDFHVDHRGCYCRATWGQRYVAQTISGHGTTPPPKGYNRGLTDEARERWLGFQPKERSACQSKSWTLGCIAKRLWTRHYPQCCFHPRSVMSPTELCCLYEHQRGNFESFIWKHPKHTATSLRPKNLYCPNLLGSNHEPPLCRYPSSERVPTPAWKRHNTKWQWYVSPIFTANNPTSHLKFANITAQIGEDQWPE